jgi:hypothetical protein
MKACAGSSGIDPGDVQVLVELVLTHSPPAQQQRAIEG